MCAKSKRNATVQAAYTDYEANLAAEKIVGSPFVVQSIKQNHPSSHYDETPITSAAPLGAMCVSCEIRNMSPFNYSFSYKTDWIDDRVLVRLDVGDGTHNNRVPGIPLEETSVPTPHIHIYRNDGYFVAYRIDGIDYESDEPVKFDYYKGYEYLCARLNIGCENKIPPAFYFQPLGQLNLMISDTDPNEGVEFPADNE